MICYVCKNEIMNFDGCMICMECVEASYLVSSMDLAILDWIKSLEFENFYWKNTKLYLKEVFNNFDFIGDLGDKLVQAKELLASLIYQHLMFYRKEDVIVGLLSIKETCRRFMMQETSSEMWKYITEYEMSVQMLNMILGKNEDEFNGAPIGHKEDGYSNLITAISLERFMVILDENLKIYKYFDCSDLTVYDLTIEQLENEATEKYHEKYLEASLGSQPEDYLILSDTLEKKLSSEQKSLNEIKKLTYHELSSQFGFGENEVRTAINLCKDEFCKSEISTSFNSSLDGNAPLLAIYDKKILVNNLKNYKEFECFVDFLSINREYNDKLDINRQQELRSFYEIGDYIIFGRIDLIQNISALEKFASSGHFIEYFNIDVNVKGMQKVQKKISARLAYVLSEKMYSNGYLVPLEKVSRKLGGGFVPRAEINKIIVDGKNILSDVGDIDVLAVNLEKKEVILVELKHYKPAITSFDLFRKDQMKISDDKVEKKMLARHQTVQDNIVSLGNQFDWTLTNDYKVKSIFVTSRANYSAVNELKNISYFTYNAFIKEVSSKDI